VIGLFKRGWVSGFASELEREREHLIISMDAPRRVTRSMTDDRRRDALLDVIVEAFFMQENRRMIALAASRGEPLNFWSDEEEKAALRKEEWTFREAERAHEALEKTMCWMSSEQLDNMVSRAIEQARQERSEMYSDGSSNTSGWGSIPASPSSEASLEASSEEEMECDE
jgi:hypothetical protein